MLEILNLYRYKSLKAYYTKLKAEAKELLQSGNVSEYLKKLTEVHRVRVQMVKATDNI